MRLLAGFLLLATAVPASANPWFLQLRHDRRGSAATINYQFRWDDKDLPSTPSDFADGLLKPIRTFDTGILRIIQSARFDFYGVRLRPFRHLTTEPTSAPAQTAQAAADNGRGIDLDPLADGLLNDGRRETKRWLIDTVFNAALPKAKGASRAQKEAVAKTLVAAGRSWDSN